MKPSKRMLGDKAYDSAELREDLHERGTKPVIPNRSNRKQPFTSASASMRSGKEKCIGKSTEASSTCSTVGCGSPERRQLDEAP